MWTERGWRSRHVCYLSWVTAASLVACSNPNYGFSGSDLSQSPAKGTDQSSGGSTGTCTLQDVTIPVRVMFAVDASGSNRLPTVDQGTEICSDSDYLTDGNPLHCSPPTDPQKTFRRNSITQFFNSYQGKTNFSWGFEIFAGDSLRPLITADGRWPNFGNSAAMVAAIRRFSGNTDQGGTPYLAALAGIKQAIENDPGLPQTGAAAPVYFVVFMSDGYPSDAINGTSPVTVDLAALKSAITGILALAPARITLSTVYYGTINDPVAASTLQTMAKAGLGQFANVDTGSISSISVNDLIKVPVGDCK
ncbi:MAG: hypothetical protein C5B49_12725 [Bdellovibrio sp.]|nr:MAG: hypothetical protein C5B49_12725 [Bdellovibrio sp.]